MILLVFTVVRAPDVDARADARRRWRGARAADRVRDDRAPRERAARAPRHPAQRPRCCAPTRARCCSSAPSSPSSSSPCSTCRSCAAGRRSRPAWRWSCSGIDAILAPTLTPRLVERFGKLPVIGAGTALAALGYALFLRLGADWTLLRHAADAAARRRRVRAHLRDADDRRHRRDRRARAGPRRRPAVRLAAVRRRGRAWRSSPRSTSRPRTGRARKPCSTATAPRCWSRSRWPRSRWP